MKHNHTMLLQLLLAALLLLVMLPAASARVTAVEPVTSAYVVTPHTSFKKSRAVVAAGRQGPPYVIWSSEYQDGDQYGIYGRSLPDGTETHLNTNTVGRQDHPAVGIAWDVMDGVVAWDEQDGERPSGIFGRAISRHPMTGEFQINQDEVYTKVAPAVAVNNRGDRAVVVWHSLGQDGYFGGIYGRRASTAGQVLGDEFQVNTFTDGSELLPDVAMAYDGRFVVAWFSWTGDGHEGIYAQRYDQDFNRVGEEMEIANFGDLGDLNHYAYAPAIAMDPVGNFVVAWSFDAHTGSSLDVYARRYYADGTPAGPAFQVNTYTPNVQAFVDVAMDQLGNSVFVWQSQGQDGSDYGIYSQVYDGAGMRVGEEFQVNTTFTGYQVEPSVAMSDVGKWVVTWTSQGQAGSDASIYARDYQHVFSTFTVNSTADPGDGICTFDECTLREALGLAAGAPHSITPTVAFNIPGDGPHTIALQSGLPTIRRPMIIDGFTQPGAQPNSNPMTEPINAVMKIEITGAGFEFLTFNAEVRGLVLNRGAALRFYRRQGIVKGCFIGTDATGTQAVGGGGIWVGFVGGVQIGGSEPAARNLISGNGTAIDAHYGVTSVGGNFIGTDVTGTKALGNGIAIAFGSSPQGEPRTIGIGGNLISGNGTSIILGDGFGGVSGNLIGTDRTGTQPLPNNSAGVAMNTYGNGVSNNVIAYNHGPGVKVTGSSLALATSRINDNLIMQNEGKAIVVTDGRSNVEIRRNQLVDNVGLGIDLADDGPTANDPLDVDTGPNQLQNTPLIERGGTDGVETQLYGTLNSVPNRTYTIDLFRSEGCDASGYGESEHFLQELMVTTDGDGNADFALTLDQMAPLGSLLMATASGSHYDSRSAGNLYYTSEASPCRPVGGVINGLLTMTGTTTEYDPTPIADAPAGTFTVYATFVNDSDAPLSDLFFKVTTLSNNNLLLNAAGGPAGEGAMRLVDGEVAPGGSFEVDFVIGLQEAVPFDFFVDVFGLPADGLAAAIDPTTADTPAIDLTMTAAELLENNDNGAAENIYLPLISR